MLCRQTKPNVHWRSTIVVVRTLAIWLLSGTLHCLHWFLAQSLCAAVWASCHRCNWETAAAHSQAPYTSLICCLHHMHAWWNSNIQQWNISHNINQWYTVIYQQLAKRQLTIESNMWSFGENLANAHHRFINSSKIVNAYMPLCKTPTSYHQSRQQWHRITSILLNTTHQLQIYTVMHCTHKRLPPSCETGLLHHI